MLDSFRFLTAGESHSETLTAVIDGAPADSIDEIRRHYTNQESRAVNWIERGASEC